MSSNSTRPARGRKSDEGKAFLSWTARHHSPFSDARHELASVDGPGTHRTSFRFEPGQPARGWRPLIGRRLRRTAPEMRALVRRTEFGGDEVDRSAPTDARPGYLDYVAYSSVSRRWLGLTAKTALPGLLPQPRTATTRPTSPGCCGARWADRCRARRLTGQSMRGKALINIRETYQRERAVFRPAATTFCKDGRNPAPGRAPAF